MEMPVSTFLKKIDRGDGGKWNLLTLTIRMSTQVVGWKYRAGYLFTKAKFGKGISYPAGTIIVDDNGHPDNEGGNVAVGVWSSREPIYSESWSVITSLNPQTQREGREDYYTEKKYPFLGKNPFPSLSKGDRKVFDEALTEAKKITEDPDCDAALQEFGIKSLSELVSKWVADQNIFDGRKSTVGFPPPSKGKARRPISEYLRDHKDIGAIASIDTLFTGKSEDITFLNNYFFSPEGDFYSQQRALILIHEAVHNFGGKKDSDFGGSTKLSEKIAEKCYPALKATKNLGNVTL